MPEERTMKKTFLFLQGNQKNIYILQAFFYLERVKFVVWVFTSDSFS